MIPFTKIVTINSVVDFKNICDFSSYDEYPVFCRNGECYFNSNNNCVKNFINLLEKYSITNFDVTFTTEDNILTHHHVFRPDEMFEKNIIKIEGNDFSSVYLKIITKIEKITNPIHVLMTIMCFYPEAIHTLFDINNSPDGLAEAIIKLNDADIIKLHCSTVMV